MKVNNISIADQYGIDSTINTKPSAIIKLQKVMSNAGWEINSIDIDLTGQKPIAEIKLRRYDNRLLWARIDVYGDCMIETFQRESRLGMDPRNKGRHPQVTLIDDVFLGRQRYEGARSMMRGMTNYLSDNALNPVALADMRESWAGIMSVPTRLLTNT